MNLMCRGFCLLALFSVLQGFNGADLRNVCTEAGMFAIRADRDYVVQEDFMKVRFWVVFKESEGCFDGLVGSFLKLC